MLREACLLAQVGVAAALGVGVGGVPHTALDTVQAAAGSLLTDAGLWPEPAPATSVACSRLSTNASTCVEQNCVWCVSTPAHARYCLPLCSPQRPGSSRSSRSLTHAHDARVYAPSSRHVYHCGHWGGSQNVVAVGLEGNWGSPGVEPAPTALGMRRAALGR